MTPVPIIPNGSRGGTTWQVAARASCLIVDYDDIRQLTAYLQPYMDLMGFDVRAINELNYEERVDHLRALGNQQPADAPPARMDFA